MLYTSAALGGQKCVKMVKSRAQLCGAGEADVHCGHNTRPYLLSHVRPSPAAQQAAAQAAASLPPALRHIADFYSSTDADRRQDALGTLLQLLQEPLQQQYARMWGSDAISVLVIKVNTKTPGCIRAAVQWLSCLCKWTTFCITLLYLFSLDPTESFRNNYGIPLQSTTDWIM